MINYEDTGGAKSRTIDLDLSSGEVKMNRGLIQWKISTGITVKF